MASKNDLELARINASAQKALAVFTIIGITIKSAFALGAVWVIVDGLKFIVINKPESISALAKVIDAFKLGHIVWLFLTVGLGVAWNRERSGKKRITARLAEMRRKYEPDESSSGLTDTGDTPE